MRQSFPASKSARPTPLVSAVTGSAVIALTALGSLSASAQIIGGIGQRSASGQRGSSASGQPAPVTNQPSASLPSSGAIFRQPQLYPQPAPSQPVLSQPYPNRGPIFRSGPSGGGSQVYSPSQSFPGQPQYIGPRTYQPLPPGITYGTLPSSGGRGGPGQEQTQRVYSNRFDTNQQTQRGFSGQLLRPVTPRQSVPQSGVGGIYTDRSVRITTPTGQRSWHSRDYGSNYLYAPVTVVGGPSLLGGYYYGSYSNTYYAEGPCYPSVYGCYPGFPQYIVNPGVIVLSDPYYPAYVAPPQPFYAPVYQVTYNQNNYYVASENSAQQIQDGGETASRAVKSAYAEGSYQAAFGDIQNAWKNADISLLRKHIRDSDTTLGVYFKGKYSYSIASGDFLKITRDAFDRLSTASFEFTRLRKAKNGDVTAYGKHVYQTAGSSDTSGDTASADNTVPFSADGTQSADATQPYSRADDPAAGAEKMIYVSYTLRKHDDQWFIIGVDSSPTALVK